MRWSRKASFALITIAGSLALATLAAELIVRAMGYTPFRPEEYAIRVEPGGVYQSADPLLGYRHLPGTFRFTFPDGHTWTATHLDDTLRITRPLQTYGEPTGKEQIWLFGCSLLHGWGVDDHQTLGWQLQRLMPGYEIVNFGVGGYGTWQSYEQYREALGQRPVPRYTVLVYAGIHDERNTRTRNWRRATYQFDRFGTTAQPYVRFGPDGELVEHFDDASYRGFFLLRHSALANFLDLALGKAEEKALRSHEVSERIVDLFAEAARNAGSRFVLAGINATPPTRSMIAYARERGIPSVDISVDMTKPENRVAWDGHPSAAANILSSRTLAEFLEGSDERR